MEIINIESGKIASLRHSEQRGIALSRNLADLEQVKNGIILNGLCICYLESGKIQFQISGKEQRVEAGQLLFCNYQQHISDLLFSADLQFRAFFISVDFMLTLASRLNLNKNILGGMMQFETLTLDISPEEARNLSLYYDLLDSKHQQTRHQRQNINSLCKAFGYEMLDLMEHHGLINQNGDTPEFQTEYSTMQQHMNRFMQLLVNTRPIERKVNWYASQLCITPKYLNVVCQKMMQKSPSAIIEREVTQRAIQMLHETSLSIKEISQQMGFTNQSHFGTFIRHATGVSPQQIRMQ